MPTLEIKPSGQLFFRDARPMESATGSGGHGASWPNPAVLFGALQAALHRSDLKECEQRNGHKFTSLKTAGPFPLCKSQWFFPFPSDIAPLGDSDFSFLSPSSEDDPTPSHLPGLRPLFSAAVPSKRKLPQWLDKDGITQWLSNVTDLASHSLKDSDLFDCEWSTGIGRDDRSSVQNGQDIYSAEYLRLRDHVSLAMHATLPDKNGEEHLTQLFKQEDRVIVGGQQRLCSVSPKEDDNLLAHLPVSLTGEACKGEDGKYRIKWLLLSPAIFPAIEEKEIAHRENEKSVEHPGGWLPNWIEPQENKVLLQIIEKSERNQRRQEKKEYRRNNKKTSRQPKSGTAITARLIAASIPGPQIISSWKSHVRASSEEYKEGPDLSKNTARATPTQLAVPAGSVYYFECEKLTDAENLIDALSWHAANRENISHVARRRSTVFGEKGFGLGVCGTWLPHSKKS